MLDFSGLPYPAMPIEARVALICAKYAAFGLIPLPIPVLFPDVPIPVEKIPAQQGTDLAVHHAARRRGRLRLLHRARARAGHQRRLLRARDQDRRAAAGAQRRHGRAHQRRVAELQLRSDQGRAAGRVHPEPADAACRSRSRSRTSIRCSRRSASLPTPLANITVLKDTAKLNPMQAISRGLAEAKKLAGLGDRKRQPRRAALRPGAQGARARRRARRRHRLRRAVLRAERDQHAQARRVQAELQPDPQRPDLDHAARCRYEQPAEVLRQVPRHGAEQHRPDAAGPAAGAGARRRRPDPGHLGDAVRAGRRHPERHVRAADDRLRACGSSSSRAIPTTRSGSGCFWGSAAEVPALARATPPGGAGDHAADAAAERHDGVRSAGAHRRDHAEERDRARR